VEQLIFASVFSLFPAIWVDLFLKTDREIGSFLGLMSFIIVYSVSFPVFLGVHRIVDEIKSKFSDKLEKRKKTVLWSILSGMTITIGVCCIKPLWRISQYQYNGFSNIKGFKNPYVNLYLWDYYFQLILLKGTFILSFGIYLLLKFGHNK